MEVAAMDSDVLTNVENDPIKAALRQPTFQSTVWIVQPAPVNRPWNLIDDFDLIESVSDVLQVLQGFERALHQAALLAVTLESNHQVVRSATNLAEIILEAFCFLDQGCQAGVLGLSGPGSFLSITGWLRHF